MTTHIDWDKGNRPIVWTRKYVDKKEVMEYLKNKKNLLLIEEPKELEIGGKKL